MSLNPDIVFWANKRPVAHASLYRQSISPPLIYHGHRLVSVASGNRLLLRSVRRGSMGSLPVALLVGRRSSLVGQGNRRMSAGAAELSARRGSVSLAGNMPTMHEADEGDGAENESAEETENGAEQQSEMSKVVGSMPAGERNSELGSRLMESGQSQTSLQDFLVLGTDWGGVCGVVWGVG